MKDPRFRALTCPHCRTAFRSEIQFVTLEEDSDGCWAIEEQVCPSCGRSVLYLANPNVFTPNLVTPYIVEYASRSLVRPKAISRADAPANLPDKYKGDYSEACLVLADSPKASAALSRRCLQNLLREEAKTKGKDLADQIQEVLDSGKLPSQLADNIDAIRNIGNFAAHPIKSTNTGEIVEVEPGEAEWTLDVLEELFDFYVVQPAKAKAKRDALNQKLTDMNKPPIKQSPTVP
jgi:uncharacterized protein DUF4145